eukprot:CAMPEP_0115437154 /NCGR_PEP_ID=MMETSP0271-20121206/34586_1 /TAXON_ID=71861 /ORGANISM="Scrippsiella trochoidea, Strain CCMP3099" /LENGTH=218 /DNA_ID=CAMNT_0002862749 /DNA_START=175 /DNA_END=831 /DNA_ORIENTATION=+
MLAGGFLMTDIFWLRCLLTSGYITLTTYHLLQLRPLRIPLAGSLVFFVVNSGMALWIFKERFMTLDAEEASIYAEHFESTMSILDFKTLMSYGRIVSAKDPTELMKVGQNADLILVLEGRAQVLLDEGKSFFIERQGLLGEVSFVNGGVASATAVAMPGCRYIVWSRECLNRELINEPSLQKGLELKIGRELMHKLANRSWTPENLRRELSSTSQHAK